MISQLEKLVEERTVELTENDDAYATGSYRTEIMPRNS